MTFDWIHALARSGGVEDTVIHEMVRVFVVSILLIAAVGIAAHP